MNITTSASCSIEPDSRRSDKLRPLVLAVLDRARQLRQRQHRDVQFLGERLQPLGDLADLQHAVLRPRAGRGAHQLQIIDDDQRQPLGALQPPAARAQRRQRDRRRVVDLDRQRGDLARHLHELVEIPLADVAAADAVAGDPRFLAQQAGGQLFGAHFQREDRRRCASAARSGRSARASASSDFAAPNAILVASEVLPMPGRPARITRSDGCSPPILASRSRRPVVRPETWPVRLNARSAPWIASVSARSKRDEAAGDARRRWRAGTATARPPRSAARRRVRHRRRTRC